MGVVEPVPQVYMTEKFDCYLRSWVSAACEAWGYPKPEEEYYTRLARRLPQGLRALLGVGVAEGIIIPQGPKFTLKDLSGKGPYAWFSQRSTPQEPAANWEYFVQAAEFVRLTHVAASHGFMLTFEDQLMDLALYRDGRLVVCCEVKERAGQIQDLLKHMKRYEEGIDLSRPDRGNDPLRKAKYLVKRRPDYLSLVSIGARLEYRVHYPEGKAFELTRDVIPWV